jgi:DNA modification methylase
MRAFQGEGWALVNGDCVQAMAKFKPCRFDAVVTDPPYELGFMGKSWDASGIAFDPNTWRAVWRVLKPGGYLLAFGGSRTFHRIAVAIEDAGFEIRDTLSWNYGTGFPKSKTDKSGMQPGMGTALKPAFEPVIMARKPVPLAETVRAAALEALECLCQVDTSAKMDTCLFESLQAAGFWSTAPSLSATLDALSKPGSTFTTETAFALTIDLKTLSSSLSRITPGTTTQDQTPDVGRLSVACTAAASSSSVLAKCERLSATTAGALAIGPPAETGTAPGGARFSTDWEPIIMARKPLGGRTVAANVAEWGTGALNIDGCRIASAAPVQRAAGGPGGYSEAERESGHYEKGTGRQYQDAGRWPANVCLDEEAARLLDEQSGHLRPGESPNKRSGLGYMGGASGQEGRGRVVLDRGGGASRFYYVAKASRAERDAGCEHLPAKSGGEATDREDGSIGTQNPRAGAGRTGGARNHHPTVKPIALMRWLVRLVTPPGGCVLDPFTGSGTTGVAALEEGFNFVGMEQSEEYAEIIRARLTHARRVDHESSEVSNG